MRFAWNIGDLMTCKVLHCNEDPHKFYISVCRGVVFPCSPTAVG